MYSTIAIIAFAVCVQNEILGQPIQVKWEQNVQICGSQLTDFILGICKINYYNNPEKTDRVPTNSRQKRRIVDECCKVPCTYGYIYENYCYRNYDTTTEFILLEKRSKTPVNDDALRIAINEKNNTTTSSTASTTTGSIPTAATNTTTDSTTTFVTSTNTNVVTGTVTSTTAPSWFESWLNAIKFW